MSDFELNFNAKTYFWETYFKRDTDPYSGHKPDTDLLINWAEMTIDLNKNIPLKEMRRERALWPYFVYFLRKIYVSTIEKWSIILKAFKWANCGVNVVGRESWFVVNIFPFFSLLTLHAKSRKNNPTLFSDIYSVNHTPIFIHRLITMTLFVVYF